VAVPTDTQTVRAQAKWVRMSARKGRVVAEHIRGRSVPEARAVLAFTQRAAAREIEKVLASAVANAEANHGLRGDDLVVHTAVVDEGPTLKRWRARARGRVARIKKRTCHITLQLVPATPVETGRAPRRAPAPAPAPAPEQPEAPVAEEAPKPKRAAKPKAEATDTTEKTETTPKKPRTPRRKKSEES
jgi:large subunit ribosomal protein L22